MGQPATHAPLSHRLIRCLLALLAVLALNLQGMRHYEPRMLLAASLCSTAPSDDAKGSGSTTGMDCGFCCASPHTPAAPADRVAFKPALLASEALPTRALATLAATPAWQPGRPRGPPEAA